MAVVLTIVEAALLTAALVLIVAWPFVLDYIGLAGMASRSGDGRPMGGGLGRPSGDVRHRILFRPRRQAGVGVDHARFRPGGYWFWSRRV